MHISITRSVTDPILPRPTTALIPSKSSVMPTKPASRHIKTSSAKPVTLPLSTPMKSTSLRSTSSSPMSIGTSAPTSSFQTESASFEAPTTPLESSTTPMETPTAPIKPASPSEKLTNPFETLGATSSFETEVTESASFETPTTVTPLASSSATAPIGTSTASIISTSPSEMLNSPFDAPTSTFKAVAPSIEAYTSSPETAIEAYTSSPETVTFHNESEIHTTPLAVQDSTSEIPATSLYSPTACNAGYFGSGVSCTPCMSCDTNAADSGCPAGSTTINMCTCNAGFSGNGSSCAQCLAECGPNAAACQSSGVESCTCNAGYYQSQFSGCDAAPAERRVLIVAADQASYDVQSTLLATGVFAAVDLFDVSSATPTLLDLVGYAAVLVFSGTGGSGLHSPSALGDVLADYWVQGGAVMLMQNAAGVYNCLLGRFGPAEYGYELMDCSDSISSNIRDSLGTVNDKQSPIMAGVEHLSALAAFQVDGEVINGGIVVATWASGRPLVITGTRAGRPLVLLNMYPVSSNVDPWFVQGDVGKLISNALLYLACTGLAGPPKNAASFTCTKCIACGANAINPGCPAEAAGNSNQSCICNAGYYGNGLSCTSCIKNLTCGANSIATSCPAGSTAVNTCICKAGFYGDGVSCTPCDVCDPNAADTGCPAGSTDINLCTCNAGFYGNANGYPGYPYPLRNSVICIKCSTCDAGDSGYFSACAAGVTVINICTCNANSYSPSKSDASYYEGVQYCPAGFGLPADVRILIVSSAYPVRNPEVQSLLLRTGPFTTVDIFNALTDTPTLSYLQGYSALLLFSDYPFYNRSALDDVLADYWDYLCQ